MHTFKTEKASFIFNPDLSGEMEIVVKGLTNVRISIPGEAMKEFMAHVREFEDENENENLWNDLRILRAISLVPDEEHVCENGPIMWGVCAGCEADKKRDTLSAKLRMGNSMSDKRHRWMMRDPLQEE